MAEPHGVVGYLGLKTELQKHPDAVGIFLETAHPIKFLDVVQPILEIVLPIPSQIAAVLNKEKQRIPIDNYHDLKKFMLTTES